MSVARTLTRAGAVAVAALVAASLPVGAAAAPAGPDEGAKAALESTTDAPAAESVEVAEAAEDPGLIPAGRALPSGSSLASEDGRDLFAMQTDGNLVLYTDGKAVWQAGTSGNPGARAAFQRDGNLVVYSTAGRVLWTSRTNGTPDAVLLLGHGEAMIVGDDLEWQTRTGRDRLRSGRVLPSGTAIVENPLLWYGVSQPDFRLARVAMQSDGNLVVYSYLGKAEWQSGTSGNPGARAVMQKDGNLVVYSATGRALWQSGTRGTGVEAVMGGIARNFSYQGDVLPIAYFPDQMLLVDRSYRFVAVRPNVVGPF